MAADLQAALSCGRHSGNLWITIARGPTRREIRPTTGASAVLRYGSSGPRPVPAADHSCAAATVAPRAA